jgi:hypothetical protein
MSLTARLVSRLRCGVSSRRLSGYVALDSGSRRSGGPGETQAKMRGNTPGRDLQNTWSVGRTTPASNAQDVGTEILDLLQRDGVLRETDFSMSTA